MKEEYAFSAAEKGKFYRPDAEFLVPIFLEPDVNEFLGRLAAERELDVQQLANEWLRATIQLLQSVEQPG
jgi:hypothetical protein